VVILSPKLARYKGTCPRDRVLVRAAAVIILIIDISKCTESSKHVLRHLKINVPTNLDTDRHVLKTVSEAITKELKQVRSGVKKVVSDWCCAPEH
jgi:hypothetical protein